MSTWNPRYIAYASAGGCTPETMLARDAARFPGGRMTGFICWIGRRWADWDALHRHGPNHGRSEAEQAAFTAWLPLGAWFAQHANPAREGIDARD